MQNGVFPMDFSETAQRQIILAAVLRLSLFVGADAVRVVSQDGCLGVSQKCFADSFPHHNYLPENILMFEIHEEQDSSRIWKPS